MSNSPALVEVQSNLLTPPWTDLCQLPAKLTKHLWVNPSEFLITTHALAIAEWAVGLCGHLRPTLPAPSRRGPKRLYRDSSVIVIALIHVAWQLSYEEVVDYFRAHADAASAAGFAPGQVISVGQYWERRRALGILPFWFFFVGMVWQLIRLAVIQGTDVIMDATTQRTWFHDDPEAGWSFPKPCKGSVWGYKVHMLVCRWAQLPVMFLITPAHRQECLVAIPLLTLAVVFFGFSIKIVRADAGYFTTPISVHHEIALD